MVAGWLVGWRAGGCGSGVVVSVVRNGRRVGVSVVLCSALLCPFWGSHRGMEGDEEMYISLLSCFPLYISGTRGHTEAPSTISISCYGKRAWTGGFFTLHGVTAHVLPPFNLDLCGSHCRGYTAAGSPRNAFP